MDISTFDLPKLLPLLIPILIIQIGLQIWALIDLYRQPVSKGPKWIWVLVILLLEILGPVVYFLFGKREA